MGSREKDQADFDLERFIDMFDTAITSDDPRVVETLRKLLMIVALTSPETSSTTTDRRQGPLRRLFEDMHNLNQRMHRMDEELRHTSRQLAARSAHAPSHHYDWNPVEPYSMAAAQMAKDIDADILKSAIRNINTPGLNQVQPKGKLTK